MTMVLKYEVEEMSLSQTNTQLEQIGVFPIRRNLIRQNQIHWN